MSRDTSALFPQATILVPYAPPSVNNYVRHTKWGAHYKIPAARKFITDVCILSGGKQIRAIAYKVVIKIWLGPKQKGDLDNFAKLCLDSLVKAQVIHSDAAVTELVMQKFRDKTFSRTEMAVYVNQPKVEEEF